MYRHVQLLLRNKNLQFYSYSTVLDRKIVKLCVKNINVIICVYAFFF